MISLNVLVICLSLVAASFSQQQICFSAQTELQRHNVLRARHGVANLTLDSFLNIQAQTYANKLAATGIFTHSGAPNLGENLYWTSGSYNSPNATDAWYNEISLYNFNTPGFSPATGHFTQVVWKNTTKVGFGFARGYIVANYSPPGNWRGQYELNVPRPTTPIQ